MVALLRSIGQSSSPRMGRRPTLAFFLVGVSLGCSPHFTDSSGVGGSGATSNSAGSGEAGGHGVAGTPQTSGGGANGHGTGTASDGGVQDADGGAGQCQTLGTTFPKPSGYVLPSYDGITDGLCDAAESIGCYVNDFGAAEEVACTANYDSCCFVYSVFEPEPCGWVGCGGADCTNALAHETYVAKSPVCHFCASDADCGDLGQVCNMRVGNRMACGPK